MGARGLTEDKFHVPFLLDDVLQSRYHLVMAEGSKPETGTPRLQGGDDFGEVVTDQAEPRVLSKLFYHCTSRKKQEKVRT